MMDILIKNAIIVTVNKEREVIFDGALVVKDNKIADIGNSKEIESKYTDVKKIIDAKGKVLFPGFINTHNHLFQTLLKGLGDDMVLKDWLETMTFPAANYLEPKDTYDAAMLGCIEGLRSGITTMVDYMYPHSKPGLCDGIIDAYKELGIRGILGRGCMNTGAQFGVHPGIMQDVETVEKDVRRLFEKHHNTENGRIKIGVAPAAIWSNSQEMLEMLWRVVKEYDDALFTVHISETPFDREAAKELHGQYDIDVLEKLGILGPNVLMVHCVYLTEKDMELNAVLTIGRIEWGARRNIIAENIKMEGTMRCFSPEVYEKMKLRVRELARGFELAYNCKVNINIIDDYIAVKNDKDLYQEFVEAIGSDIVVELEPLMISEDFSYYQKEVPGLFFMLGSRNEEKGFVNGLHNINFNFDEKICVNALNVYSKLLKYKEAID
ncbi:M20/M25/M40 family metallo-hydrolase [Clostridioides difficile]|nr:M20/M25/M40 family metallo-hydrolase [Clostridioides difficile]